LGPEIRLRTDALEWRRVQGQLVVMDLRSSKYLRINRTGTVLWDELVQGASRDQLLSRLETAFEVDRAAAVRDLEAFLAGLRKWDLLEPAPTEGR
jgi:hypothetical protein